MNTNVCISELIRYALEKRLIEKEDAAYATNRVLYTLGLSDFTPTELPEERRPLAAILSDLCDAAFENGKLAEKSVVYRDLFDTELMGIFTPRPSDVTAIFRVLYEKDPRIATEYFYTLAKDTNYIRTDRIEKDMKWKVPSPYGEIDITVNLSKPEKDPKAIAAAKLLPPSGYPKCLLCHENEGYAGTLSKPARQNLRQIPFEMAGALWYLQYSPYVYYNEHCIALSAEHTPMKIDRGSFRKALAFVGHFPHYFIGQNADLPIVGGSILTHDHMQGGRYTFAMERAEVRLPLRFDGYPDIRAGIVRWPMSVIRLTGSDPERLTDLADKILLAWRAYTDEGAFVFAETDGEKHNTITPIARRRGEDFELDLVLRNNITTKEHPLGVYHPHAEYHNIKKENIGLIEVMGLAVLPARLKEEIALLSRAILADEDFSADEKIGKHYAWFCAFRDRYTFTEENVEEILKAEIGNTFVNVLRDAGVYKDTEEGTAAFLRFVSSVGGDTL